MGWSVFTALLPPLPIKILNFRPLLDCRTTGSSSSSRACRNCLPFSFLLEACTVVQLDVTVITIYTYVDNFLSSLAFIFLSLVTTTSWIATISNHLVCEINRSINQSIKLYATGKIDWSLHFKRGSWWRMLLFLFFVFSFLPSFRKAESLLAPGDW